MVSAYHSKQTPSQGIHGIVAFIYANSTARLAATGFVVEDLYKIALQLSDSSLWILTSYSPIVWTAVGTGGGGGSQSLSSVLTIGNDATNLQIKNLATPTSSGDAVNKSYVDGYVGTQLSTVIKQDGSIIFSSDQSMGGNKLTSLATPISSGDATNKSYVDGYIGTQLSTVIKQNGSVIFTANQSMGNNKIIALATPTASTDAANKSYVDGYVTTQLSNVIKQDGSVTFITNQSMGGNKLTSLAIPTISTDATNKSYVDGYINNLGGSVYSGGMPIYSNGIWSIIGSAQTTYNNDADGYVTPFLDQTLVYRLETAQLTATRSFTINDIFGFPNEYNNGVDTRVSLIVVKSNSIFNYSIFNTSGQIFSPPVGRHTYLDLAYDGFQLIVVGVSYRW